jgi:hypothetical protein
MLALCLTSIPHEWKAALWEGLLVICVLTPLKSALNATLGHNLHASDVKALDKRLFRRVEIASYIAIISDKRERMFAMIIF